MRLLCITICLHREQGLAPLVAEELARIVTDINNEDITVLLLEQNV